MHIAHLTASTFFGGPERQILGLAHAMESLDRSTIISFSEGNRCEAFLSEVRKNGFQGIHLEYDTPHLGRAMRALTQHLKQLSVDVILCHSYKANLLGRIAARRLGIPAIAVSRGWTGENVKVRFYEAIDRYHLRYMDHVICVSNGQARKVRATGVARHKISVIRNASRLDAFRCPDPEGKIELRRAFPNLPEAAKIVVAAGRLSPEKGFDVLIRAAAEVVPHHEDVYFVLFGEGAERAKLEALIGQFRLHDRFILGGFRSDLDRLLPWADLVVLSSYTEGLPNVLLEASAAGVPVVATAVGGTPELIRDGLTGLLVPPGDATVLGAKIAALLNDVVLRTEMGNSGRAWMMQAFSFAGQAVAYRSLLARIRTNAGRRHNREAVR